MKISVFEYTAFCFALGWVITDMFMGSHAEKVFAACLSAFIAGFTHNIHGIFMEGLKTSFRKS